MEQGEGSLVLFVPGIVQGLLHELQAARAVALNAVGGMLVLLAAPELAGNDGAVILSVDASLRRRPQKPPILVMHLDDGFAKLIDLLRPAELIKGRNGQF